MHADYDDEARRLLAEKWPGEDDLYLVREEGVRLVRVPETGVSSQRSAKLPEPPARAATPGKP